MISSSSLVVSKGGNKGIISISGKHVIRISGREAAALPPSFSVRAIWSIPLGKAEEVFILGQKKVVQAVRAGKHDRPKSHNSKK